MAFSYTTKSTVFGNKRVTIGTFTNADTSTTGGAIATGLKEIEYWNAGNESGANAIYGTCSGGTLTITTAAGVCGKFIAIGN